MIGKYGHAAAQLPPSRARTAWTEECGGHVLYAAGGAIHERVVTAAGSLNFVEATRHQTKRDRKPDGSWAFYARHTLTCRSSDTVHDWWEPLTPTATDRPHRGGLSPEPALPAREPVQRPIRHHASLPGKQLLDLGNRQRRLTITAGHPLGDLLLADKQQIPRRTMTVRTRRTDRGDHRTDQLIGQRLDPGIPGQTLGLSRPDISAGGLAVHTRPFGDPAQANSFEPTAEYLSYLNHTDLPESHR